MSQSRQFGRSTRITIGPEPNTGVVIDDRFHTVFSVSQDDSEESNNISVQIYGLNDDTRARIEKDGQTLLIEAGYRGAREILSISEVKRIEVLREFPGVLTLIEATDGGNSLSSIRLSLSFGEGYSVQNALQKVATDSGLPIRIASNLNLNVPYRTGASFTGTLKSILSEIVTRVSGVRWTITDGEILIFNRQSENLQSRVVLTPSTGLIESPSRLEDDENEQGAIGFRCLLQPKIRPNTEIQLDSIDFSGIYKVKRVTHSGSNRTGDWISSCEAVEA